MSQVLYASRKFDDCDVEMVSISHAVGVFNRHMAKLSQEHGNECFKHKGTSITYSGCSDLVCVYDS